MKFSNFTFLLDFFFIYLFTVPKRKPGYDRLHMPRTFSSTSVDTILTFPNNPRNLDFTLNSIVSQNHSLHHFPQTQCNGNNTVSIRLSNSEIYESDNKLGYFSSFHLLHSPPPQPKKELELNLDVAITSYLWNVR